MRSWEDDDEEDEDSQNSFVYKKRQWIKYS